MAESKDAITASLEINLRLSKAIGKAVEKNSILRIGWTSSGTPTPKEGEMGLCPGLPKGARVRALGRLGDFISAASKGGTFTIQGEAGDFLGAGNDGGEIICEGQAGDWVGWSMQEGKITVLGGVGDDAGAQMHSGLVVIRGHAGKRIGGGMKGGCVVVHGDVGSDPGAGMQGGMIIINGRCPQPAPGVTLRTLTPLELKDINSKISDDSMEVPSDAVCLCADDVDKQQEDEVKDIGDLSSIGIVPTSRVRIPKHATVDTVVLLGEKGGEAMGLPLPLIPILDSVKAKGRRIDLQPCIVRKSPRRIDFVLINAENFHQTPELLTKCQGFLLDFASLPPMDSENIDGLIVAMKGLCPPDSTLMMLDGLSSCETIHSTSSHHNADLVAIRMMDGSGIPSTASLPIIGRSTMENLQSKEIVSAVELSWQATSSDLAILCASGIMTTICPAPKEIEEWLGQLECGLSDRLRQIGISSIDELERKHLRALTHETASTSGLRLTGYERPLPHWFAR